jgi:hypothetical protein
MQAWPWLWKMAKALPWTAAARSASSKTMLAPLPPSSSWRRLRLPAEARTIWRPTSVEPVNDSLATPGCSASRAPATWPKPGTTLTTPGGKPASAISSATARVDSGVSSAGLRTTVLPAARAGPSFQLVNISGKFQGTIWPTTPTGLRTT